MFLIKKIKNMFQKKENIKQQNRNIQIFLNNFYKIFYKFIFFYIK